MTESNATWVALLIMLLGWHCFIFGKIINTRMTLEKQYLIR
jgi:hypothetical protein